MIIAADYLTQKEYPTRKRGFPPQAAGLCLIGRSARSAIFFLMCGIAGIAGLMDKEDA